MVTKKCKHCSHNHWWRIGFNSKGHQRFRCSNCRKEFSAYEVLGIQGIDEVIEYAKTAAFQKETRLEAIEKITEIIFNNNTDLAEDTEIVEDLDSALTDTIIDSSNNSAALNTVGRLSRENEILTKKEHLTFNIMLKLLEKHNLDALKKGAYNTLVDWAIKATDIFLEKVKD
ncbi:MAG: hypothetical protein FWC41_06420 [Firmicutes bacterium]|nr:hypothetical protein [Bacillota bacterium]